MSHTVLILNGPNLNLLGQREPDIYGHQTLGDIEKSCLSYADRLGLGVIFRQTNYEGQLIDWMQDAGDECEAIILNAGALTHVSLALLDTIRSIDLPVIEVHLSNPYARESYRHHSYVSQAASGVICGFGARSYLLALDAAGAMIGVLKDDDKKTA